MEAAYIVPLIRATEHVFSTVLQSQVEVQAPSLKSDNAASHDVSGIIGLSGDVTGAIVLSFPMAVAERVVSKFTGMEMTQDHEDFADAIGELVNMIAGNAKAKFDGKRVSISCPSVVVGSGHQVFQSRDATIVEIPCSCDCGAFLVDVSIKEAKTTASSATTVGAQA